MFDDRFVVHFQIKSNSKIMVNQFLISNIGFNG